MGFKDSFYSFFLLLSLNLIHLFAFLLKDIFLYKNIFEAQILQASL